MNDNVIIRTEDVQKHFKGGAIKALDGVSTSIHQGEVVVVIGPSGSGKSTFLRLEMNPGRFVRCLRQNLIRRCCRS